MGRSLRPQQAGEEFLQRRTPVRALHKRLPRSGDLGVAHAVAQGQPDSQRHPKDVFLRRVRQVLQLEEGLVEAQEAAQGHRRSVDQVPILGQETDGQSIPLQFLSEDLRQQPVAATTQTQFPQRISKSAAATAATIVQYQSQISRQRRASESEAYEVGDGRCRQFTNQAVAIRHGFRRREKEAGHVSRV